MPERKNINTILAKAYQRFKIERANDFKKEEAFNFFKYAYSDQFNAKDFEDEETVMRRWKWENLENPNIKDIGFPAWFCKDKATNEIVGHLGVMPISIKINNEAYLAVWGRGMIVPLKFRRLGIGSILFATVMNETRNKAALFLLAGSNDYAVSIYKKFGFIHLGYIPVYIRPLRTSGVIRKYIKSGLFFTILNLLAKILIEIFYFISGINVKREFKDISIKEIFSFDKSFDRLWEKVSYQINIIAIRNSENLRWRFIEQPYWDYKIFKAENVHSGELRGYIVLREGISCGLQVGIICDVFASPDDKDTISTLLTFAIKYFKRNTQVDLIRCDILNGKFEHYFKKMGFIRMPSKSHFLVTNIKAGLDPKFIYDKSNWFVNRADSDLDLSESRN